MSEIGKLEALQGGSEINEAKKMLATEATALLHGRDAANESRRDGAKAPSSKARLAESLPTVEIPRGELEAGIGVLERPSSRPASSPRMARPAARSRAAACASTMPSVTDEKMTF